MLEQQVQMVTSKSPHFFAKHANQATYIKALILSNGMPILWITINLSNLQSQLILIFIGMEYKFNDANTFAKVFIITMNFIAMARFFKAIYCSICEYLLTVG